MDTWQLLPDIQGHVDVTPKRCLVLQPQGDGRRLLQGVFQLGSWRWLTGGSRAGTTLAFRSVFNFAERLEDLRIWLSPIISFGVGRGVVWWG